MNALSSRQRREELPLDSRNCLLLSKQTLNWKHKALFVDPRLHGPYLYRLYRESLVPHSYAMTIEISIQFLIRIQCPLLRLYHIFLCTSISSDIDGPRLHSKDSHNFLQSLNMCATYLDYASNLTGYT